MSSISETGKSQVSLDQTIAGKLAEEPKGKMHLSGILDGVREAHVGGVSGKGNADTVGKARVAKIKDAKLIEEAVEGLSILKTQDPDKALRILDTITAEADIKALPLRTRAKIRIAEREIVEKKGVTTKPRAHQIGIYVAETLAAIKDSFSDFWKTVRGKGLETLSEYRQIQKLAQGKNLGDEFAKAVNQFIKDVKNREGKNEWIPVVNTLKAFQKVYETEDQSVMETFKGLVQWSGEAEDKAAMMLAISKSGNAKKLLEAFCKVKDMPGASKTFMEIIKSDLTTEFKDTFMSAMPEKSTVVPGYVASFSLIALGNLRKAAESLQKAQIEYSKKYAHAFYRPGFASKLCETAKDISVASLPIAQIPAIIQGVKALIDQLQAERKRDRSRHTPEFINEEKKAKEELDALHLAYEAAREGTIPTK